MVEQWTMIKKLIQVIQQESRAWEGHGHV